MAQSIDKTPLKASEIPQTHTITLAGITPNTSPITKKEPLYKNLSVVEFQRRKEKGLCFRCKESYTVGHKCKSQELTVLLLHDEEVDEMEVEEMGTMGKKKEEIGDTVELSLNTVVGFLSSGTMELKAQIKQLSLVVLVDCGATHNFI